MVSEVARHRPALWTGIKQPEEALDAKGAPQAAAAPLAPLAAGTGRGDGHHNGGGTAHHDTGDSAALQESGREQSSRSAAVLIVATQQGTFIQHNEKRIAGCDDRSKERDENEAEDREVAAGVALNGKLPSGSSGT